jgi:hypothetical protein
MKTNSDQINKQVLVIKNKLKTKNDFLDLATICRLFRPALSEKAAKDRLLKIKDSESEFYLLEDLKLGYKLIDRHIDWTLYKFLREKKSKLKKPIVKTAIYDRGMADNIKNLHLGMEKGLYVDIVNYTPVNASKNYNPTVFPLKMILSETPHILAYDKGKVKQFNIGRMGSVILTSEKVNINPSRVLKNELLDDFGFTCADKKLWKIELLFTNYAMTMFIRDFHYLDHKIKIIKPALPVEMINGEEHFFLYSIKLHVGSIRVIGRFVTGILSHVKVKDAPDEFKQTLREYIQNKVINVFEKHI